MWFESQNCAMMGLQATTGKRKLEAATAPAESSPPKNGRWEAEDCIARLQAVAVPSDTWRCSPTPSLAATLLSTTTSVVGCGGGGGGNNSSSDDYEDDDEFDDELSDDDRCVIPEPARFTSIINNNNNNNNTSNSNNNNNNSNNTSNTSNNQSSFGGRYQQQQQQQSDYWQYYQPPQQQTIRCEENGKSYLELGASPPSPIRSVRCCDGRTRWCHVPCYRQRRLAVLNLSMCKLARYRQCSDPSLRRSVLICNTLRRLEREMESEPPEPNYTLPEMSPPSRPSPVQESPNYEQSLREMTCPSGRATPFPTTNHTDNDSGLGDDEMTRPINWGSVLSLSSQTDLESLNNNEFYAELGLSSDPPVEWKEQTTTRMMTTTDNDWDGFMHVLVGGT